MSLQREFENAFVNMHEVNEEADMFNRLLVE